MSTIPEALASPVCPGIADAVWQAHEEQIARRSHEGFVARGEVRVSITGGIQFVPESPEDGDRIHELFGDRDWHLGIKASISL